MRKELEKSIDLQTFKKWSGTKYKTLCCNDTIQSKYSGQFVSCECGDVAIDETPHYGRVIGDINMLEAIED